MNKTTKTILWVTVATCILGLAGCNSAPAYDPGSQPPPVAKVDASGGRSSPGPSRSR